MVERGQVAVVHFTGRVADGPDSGEAFDTTDVDVALAEGIYHDHRDYGPIEVRVGAGEALPGFEDALLGMASGEERTVELSPDEAFGPRDETAIVEVDPTALVDEADELDPETLVTTDDGRTGWVTAVEDDAATVDFNHELADVPIELEIRVLDVYGTSDGPAEATDDSDEMSNGSDDRD